MVFSQVLQTLLRHTGTLTSQNKVSRERDEIDKVNKEHLTVAKSMAKSVGVDNELITIPRTRGREQNRDNTPAETLQQYYKRSITIPFLDHWKT